MDHVYNPDPKTGACVECPVRRSLSGCLWCTHGSSEHTGVVDPAVLKHYEIVAPGPIGGDPVVSSSVRWTPRACSVRHCACRRYEVRGR